MHQRTSILSRVMGVKHSESLSEIVLILSKTRAEISTFRKKATGFDIEIRPTSHPVRLAYFLNYRPLRCISHAVLIGQGIQGPKR